GQVDIFAGKFLVNRPRVALTVGDGVDDFLAAADAVTPGIELRSTCLQRHIIDYNASAFVRLQTEFLLDELALLLLPERLDNHVARQHKFASGYRFRCR